jgi:outer membrane biosynthesis protein TonB
MLGLRPKNTILKISYQGDEQIRHQTPISLDEKYELLIQVRNHTFRVMPAKDRGQVVFTVDDLADHKVVLSGLYPIKLERSEYTYYFQLGEDFVASDNNIFSKFLKYSLIFHAAIFVVFTISAILFPYQKSTLVEVDQKRIQELMQKMKEHEKPTPKVAQAKPTAAPTPMPTAAPIKVTPEAKPTKLAEKPTPAPKKIQKEPPPKLSSTKAPPPPKKEPKIKEPPPKLGGGERISAKPDPGGGKKVRTSLAAKAPTGPPPGSALQVQKMKTSIASSLSFLSGASSKYSVAPPVSAIAKKYDDKAARALGSVAGAGGGQAKGNYLNQLVMVQGNGGDGPIRTVGARRMATGDVVAADGDPRGVKGGKSLNDIQGKVSLKGLYNYGYDGGQVGGALGGKGLSVSGMAEADVIKKLQQYLQKFQYCYEKALLSKPGLAGGIWLKWNIASGGSVSNSKVTKSELNDNKLHGCILSVLQGIRFDPPKGGGMAEVDNYYFNFTQEAM